MRKITGLEGTFDFFSSESEYLVRPMRKDRLGVTQDILLISIYFLFENDWNKFLERSFWGHNKQFKIILSL